MISTCNYVLDARIRLQNNECSTATVKVKLDIFERARALIVAVFVGIGSLFTANTAWKAAASEAWMQFVKGIRFESKNLDLSLNSQGKITSEKTKDSLNKDKRVLSSSVSSSPTGLPSSVLGFSESSQIDSAQDDSHSVEVVNEQRSLTADNASESSQSKNQRSKRKKRPKSNSVTLEASKESPFTSVSPKLKLRQRIKELENQRTGKL